jgi:hypothetical protein
MRGQPSHRETASGSAAPVGEDSGAAVPSPPYASLFRRRRDAASGEGTQTIEQHLLSAELLATAQNGEREGSEAGEAHLPADVLATHAEATDGLTSRPDVGVIDAPRRPQSLAETGLTLAQLSDLLLKLVYLHGSLTGYDAAGHVRLPFSVIEEAITFLRRTRCLEVSSGELLGQASFRFQLTDQGRVRAREAFDLCRYVGPAPVSLRSYVTQCRRQTVAGIACDAASLARAFEGLVVREGLLDEIGPAVTSGQAIFLYGPAGNGKTVLGRRIGRWLNTSGGEIFVPYSVQVDGSIITVFDPTVHQTTDDAHFAESASALDRPGMLRPDAPDLRWRRIRRPVIVTAGELTLDMLDLRPHQGAHFYAAPAHLKANGGVFLIDDFGRQRVLPRELLNRWILPLAERIDYLTLSSGRKFAVPFEQLVIFSTNLDPRELVDDAFLRRIRHKIAVSPPTEGEFAELFSRCCAERGIPFEAGCVRQLFANRYSFASPPRWSDPQDLLEIVQSICRFRGETARLTKELLGEAARRFFCRDATE